MANHHYNLKIITSLRGILALFIIIYHITLIIPNYNPTNRFILSGHLAVDIFFIISGFFICYVYEETFTSSHFSFARYGNYLLIRLARIYPVHLCVLIMFVTLFYSIAGFPDFLYKTLHQSQSIYTYFDIFLNVMLLQNWAFTTNAPNIGWNSPSWSVSCEWILYFFFPLQIYFIRNLSKVLCITALIYFFLLLCFIGYNDIFLSIYGLKSIIRAFAGFTLGVIIYPIYIRYSNNTHHYYTCYFILTFLSLILLFTIKIPFAVQYIFVMFASAIIIILSTLLDDGILKKLLTTKVSIYFGTISYSLYILHWLTIMMVQYYLVTKNITLLPVYHILLLVAFCLFNASIFYYFIEKPFRLYIKRILSERV